MERKLPEVPSDTDPEGTKAWFGEDKPYRLQTKDSVEENPPDRGLPINHELTNWFGGGLLAPPTVNGWYD